MNHITQGLFDFIAESPVSFFTVAAAEKQLRAAGYSELLECESWDLIPGHGYYVICNQSSLVAFRVPETPMPAAGFMIGAAHTDSPCLRIKENAELQLEGYTRLDVEKYGGMIRAAWMDRPLSVAGRLLVATEDGIETRLINMDRDLAVIPGLAIHMDRTINGGKSISIQTDMIPLLGKGKLDFLALAAEAAGTEKEKILSYDLYLYNRVRGTTVGVDGEFILCPRLDDLQCVYGLLQGFLQVEDPKAIPVLALFDSEEIGSQTRQGALSPFLQDVLRRICMSCGLGESEYLRMLTGSMLVSADNAHGVHPNHPEKAALTCRPKLGDGIVFKYGEGYSTTGISAALLRRILLGSGIPMQTYYNHSDIAGGHTLGNLATTQLPVCTVDIGLAQLAMHSAVETAGTADTGYLITAMQRYFSAGLEQSSAGDYRVL